MTSRDKKILAIVVIAFLLLRKKDPAPVPQRTPHPLETPQTTAQDADGNALQINVQRAPLPGGPAPNDPAPAQSTTPLRDISDPP